MEVAFCEWPKGRPSSPLLSLKVGKHASHNIHLQEGKIIFLPSLIIGLNLPKARKRAAPAIYLLLGSIYRCSN